MAATDSESIHDNMTRLRMRMIQQKLANERERLQRPDTSSSEGGDGQLKVQQAMLRRQELIDKIRREQLDFQRPRTHSPRRRFTPSPIPPPSRRSLPDLNKTYQFNWYNQQRPADSFSNVPHLPPIEPRPGSRYLSYDPGGPPPGGAPQDMANIKHVIEHQIRQQPAPVQQIQPVVQPVVQPIVQPMVQQYQLPPVQHVQHIQHIQPAQTHIIPQVTAVQAQPMIQAMPTIGIVGETKDKGFNKGDFMDMMMIENAQMNHYIMQQMMLQNIQPRMVATAPVAAQQVMPATRPVYHHHFQAVSAPAMPPVHHYQSLPPMDGGFSRGASFGGRVMPRKKMFGRVLPANTRTDEPIANVRRTDLVRTRPYQNSKGLSRFRQFAYAAWFIAILKASVLKGKGNRPSSAFLFGIILKEIVAALQRLYLNPSGNIYPVMTDIIGPQAYDLSVLVEGGRGAEPLQKDRNGLIQILSYVLENLIYHITEIMPKTGVLGTHRKSAVFELIKTNRRFPDGYFWQVELDRLQFNEFGRTINIGNNEAFFLIIGIYLSRSLITTLLLKPIDYGLSTDALNDVNYRNLKMLSTIVLFVIRRVSVPRGQPMMSIPGEIIKHVYRDEEMKNVHISLRKSYEYSENLLREWGAEYIKRLRSAADSTSAPQPPLKPER